MSAEPGSQDSHVGGHGNDTVPADPSTPVLRALYDFESRPGQTSSRPPSNGLDDGERVDDSSPLLSRESSFSGEALVDGSIDRDYSHRADIRGFELLRHVEFWQQWAIMSLLSGIGLMTIKYVVSRQIVFSLPCHLRSTS